MSWKLFLLFEKHYSKIRLMIKTFLWCIWLYLAVLILSAPKLDGGIIFLLVFGYLILDIKHPCDYHSYKAWWADRKNWNK